MNILKILRRCAGAALGLLLALPAMAQDDFNPSNPPEPNTLYKVTVDTQPAEAGYTSGNGKYVKGKSVSVGTSARSVSFHFKHWLKDGEIYEGASSRYFTFTVGEAAVHFTAVYEYDPANPSEPAQEHRHRLWLESVPEEACSFNRTGGAKVDDGTWVILTTYPNQGFVFQGWFCDGVKLSGSESFNFEMPAADATVQARYVFNPSNPDEPEGSQQPDTSLAGDVNSDGTEDATDAVAVVAYFLGQSSESITKEKTDVNNDELVDATDAVAVVNIYINK